MWTYMRAIGRHCDINVVALGGTNNHVHVLLQVPPAARTSDIVRQLKANSSRWMNEIARGFA
jgi:REP element-mobilizing transposase RayT